jgi:hypothetical protein
MGWKIDSRDYLTRLVVACLKSPKQALAGNATDSWQWPPGFGSRLPLATVTDHAKHQPYINYIDYEPHAYR